jgi:hypothetical protein
VVRHNMMDKTGDAVDTKQDGNGKKEQCDGKRQAMMLIQNEMEMDKMEQRVIVVPSRRVIVERAVIERAVVERAVVERAVYL